MPKAKVFLTSCGPKRVFCTHAHKEKAVFSNYKAALNFLQDYTDDFTRHPGTYARSIYYCSSCGGWHLTKQIPAFTEDFPGFDGIIVNGNIYRPRNLGEGIEGCYLCDKEVVEKCRKGNFMPCLAYGSNICLKRDDTFFLTKSINVEE